MDVELLLELLDDSKVVSKIKSMLTENKMDVDFPLANNDDTSDVSVDMSNLIEENKLLKKERSEMLGFIGKLKGLLFGKDDERLGNSVELEKLAQRVNELNQLVGSLQEDNEKLIEETKLVNDSLSSSEKKLEKVEAELDLYRLDFSEDIKLQKLYIELSDKTKSSLSGIFKDTSAKGLIACGIQEKNIGNLWDYAKNEVVNGTNSDISGIVKLFNLLFSRFIIAYPMYETQSVESGDEFDTQKHIRHNSSNNMNGEVDTVILHGYVNNKTGKTIKQSVVRV